MGLKMALRLPTRPSIPSYGSSLSSLIPGYESGREQRLEDDARTKATELEEGSVNAFGTLLDNRAGSPAPPTTSTRIVNGSHAATAKAADPILSSYFAALENAESGGDPNAKNPNSSATGLHQFTNGTWNGLMRDNPQLGLTADGRTDPEQSRRALSAFTQQNAKSLGGAGIQVTPGNLYAAHFLGAGGAQSVLSMDDQTPMVAAASPEVIQANGFLQDMTVGDFKSWSSEKGGGQGGGYQAPRDPQQQAQTGLPRDAMLDLFRNPSTRQFAIDMAQSGRTPQKLTSDMKEYEFARGQGFKGSFLDFVTAQKKAGATSINNNVGASESSFSKEGGKLQAQRFDALVEQAQSANSTISDMNALREISAGFETGKGAEIMASLGPYAQAVGIEIEGLGELQAYNAIIARLAPTMRVAGSGATSDFEMRKFLESLPGLGKTPEGNAIIQNVFQAISEQKIRAGEIASEALSGDITQKEAEKMLRELPDPLALWKEQEKSITDTTEPSRPSTDEEYDALPAGALFIDPDDGQTYRKP